MSRNRLPTILIAVFLCCATGLTPQPPTDSQEAAPQLAGTAVGGTKPGAENPSADALVEINASDYDNLFPIVNGDVKVDDGRISDIRLTGITSSISKLKLAKVMLLNRGERSWKPDFTLRILNKYGVALGHGNVRWALHTLPQNERYEEEASLQTFSNSEVFKYSSVQPAPDLDRPVFIAIEHAR